MNHCVDGEVENLSWSSDEVMYPVGDVGDDVGWDSVLYRSARACRWCRRQVQHGPGHEVAKLFVAAMVCLKVWCDKLRHTNQTWPDSRTKGWI